MDRLRTGRLRDFDDRVAAQVAVLRARAADAMRFVGEAHVLRIGVGVGEHRDGADAEPARGTDDPAGDFAAVGDEDFVEHQKFSPSPSRGGPGRGWCVLVSSMR